MILCFSLLWCTVFGSDKALPKPLSKNEDASPNPFHIAQTKIPEAKSPRLFSLAKEAPSDNEDCQSGEEEPDSLDLDWTKSLSLPSLPTAHLALELFVRRADESDYLMVNMPAPGKMPLRTFAELLEDGFELIMRFSNKATGSQFNRKAQEVYYFISGEVVYSSAALEDRFALEMSLGQMAFPQHSSHLLCLRMVGSKVLISRYSVQKLELPPALKSSDPFLGLHSPKVQLSTAPAGPHPLFFKSLDTQIATIHSIKDLAR